MCQTEIKHLLLGCKINFAAFNSIEHFFKKFAEENSDDSRRRLVCTKTVVIADAGNRSSQNT